MDGLNPSKAIGRNVEPQLFIGARVRLEGKNAGRVAAGPGKEKTVSADIGADIDKHHVGFQKRGDEVSFRPLR